MKKIVSAFITACLLFSGAAAYAEGVSPIAENLELKTYVDTTLSGTLTAYDPDSEDLSFEITTNPVRGSIQLFDDGSFVYTPNAGKKGRDYFGYKAVDSEGNRSQEATVIITVEKTKRAVHYSDMEGNAGEYYAAVLSEKGIFTGECICGQYCFFPDKEISRGEFICMCIMAANEPIIKNVMKTGLEEDSFVSDWNRQYFMASVMAGNSLDASAELSDAVSRSEAVKLLNKIFKFTDINYASLIDDGEEARACANLEALGIVREGALSSERLTRLECAQMLVKAMEVSDKRVA